MYDSTFDTIAKIFEARLPAEGFAMLSNFLDDTIAHHPHWDRIVTNLRSHRLHKILLNDPFTAHGWNKPRGYAGDAALIDFMYDQTLPDEVSKLGEDLFLYTTGVPMADAARLRKQEAAVFLSDAIASKKSVCALACGHWREADDLAGSDLGRVVAVDQDAVSIERIIARHGDAVETVSANVIRYLKRTGASEERFDLIYTLGLTDYFEQEHLELFTRLAANCLAPDGRLLIGNFVPNHPARGYMDACMDWRLILRSEEELTQAANQAGLTHRTWRDATGLIAYCEMTL